MRQKNWKRLYVTMPLPQDGAARAKSSLDPKKKR
jgi:hypothetical protein